MSSVTCHVTLFPGASGAVVVQSRTLPEIAQFGSDSLPDVPPRTGAEPTTPPAAVETPWFVRVTAYVVDPPATTENWPSLTVTRRSPRTAIVVPSVSLSFPESGSGELAETLAVFDSGATRAGSM